jgi:PPIC-type PPIASE domain
VSDLRKGPLDSELTTAVFGARQGELTGPVKIDETWAVFVVERVKPPFQATLEQARDEIEELLASQRRRAVLASFTSRYRAKTNCARGYRVPGCRNGPALEEDAP